MLSLHTAAGDKEPHLQISQSQLTIESKVQVVLLSRGSHSDFSLEVICEMVTMVNVVNVLPLWRFYTHVTAVGKQSLLLHSCVAAADLLRAQ